MKYTVEEMPYEGYIIKKDGNILFPKDVAKELNKLHSKVKKLTQQINDLDERIREMNE